MWTRNGTCERDAEVRRLARWNVDAPALRRHAASCGPCRETLAVAAGMRELARRSIDTSSLLSPTSLWWKAQVLRRWDAQQQAATRLELGERMQVGGGLVAGTILLVWLWHQAPTAAVPAGLPSTVTAVMLASAVLLVATAVIAVREVLAWPSRH